MTQNEALFSTAFLMHSDSVFEFPPDPSSASGWQKIDADFLFRLNEELRPRMIVSLTSRGASREVAEDVVSEILAECVAESPRNLLARFKGVGPLDGWLLRVAINRLISRQRRERLMEPAEIGEIESLPCESMEVMEEALQAIVSKALGEAIESLPAEARLLLWLRHGYGIPQNRLCICWRSTPSKLSRALSSARRIVRDQTLRSIQTEDPGLHLQWQDISGVCSNSLLFSENRHVA